MSFRQNRSEERAWRQWISTHAEYLREVCGLAQQLLDNRDRWLYFIDHGNLELAYHGWSFGIDDLSNQQRRAFAAWLAAECPEEQLLQAMVAHRLKADGSSSGLEARAIEKGQK